MRPHSIPNGKSTWKVCWRPFGLYAVSPFKHSPFTFGVRAAAFRAAALAIGLMALGSGLANAQDTWPVDPGPSSPSRPLDATNYVLMPDQLAFWNPTINTTRVISPYGRSTKIVCMGYRVDVDCWQADRAGNPHKLDRAFYMGAFGSLVSTPAAFVFVYPGMAPALS